MGVRPEKYEIVHNEAFDVSFTSALGRNNHSAANWVTVKIHLSDRRRLEPLSSLRYCIYVNRCLFHFSSKRNLVMQNSICTQD